MGSAFRFITLPVLLLGLASLFTDIAGEAAYSVSLFSTQVLGASPFSLGLIEGVAEATASLLKLFSGYWSDRIGKSKPLVLVGYFGSATLRPLIGLASSWPQVLFFRFLIASERGFEALPATPG